MFQLDDNFLEEVGLATLPEDQKQAFLKHIYEELELRVGTKLSEGLSEEQMSEFEGFVDQNEDQVRGWFTKYMPDYQSQQDFIQLQESAPEDASELAVLCEYGSLTWLEVRRYQIEDTQVSFVRAFDIDLTTRGLRDNFSRCNDYNVIFDC